MATAILTFTVIYGMLAWAESRWPMSAWVLVFLGLFYLTGDAPDAAYLSTVCMAGLWGFMALSCWMLGLLWDKWLCDLYSRWIERRWRDD